ncbi:MAG: hypothetical protein F6K08_33305 [Okeania sp. SIO1H6]|nr:hypothetical protein [Okeania sp. SIO1H6]
MYTSKIPISYGLQGNEEKYGDNVIDFHLDDEVEGQTDIPATETVRYTLEQLAQELSISTKTIYRAGTGYYPRICECWYWLTEGFKVGERYTPLALEKMQELQEAIALKLPDGTKNPGKMQYEDFKQQVWASYSQSEPVANIVPAPKYDSSRATANMAQIFRIKNEASNVGNAIDQLTSSLESFYGQVGTEMSARCGAALVGNFNDGMAQILEQLGHTSK